MSDEVELVPCPDPDEYWLMYGEQFMTADGRYYMRFRHANARPETARPERRGLRTRWLAVYLAIWVPFVTWASLYVWSLR